MKKLINLSLFTLLLFSTAVLFSCSETDDTVEEFADWKNTNDAYFSALYKTASEKEAAGDKVWKVIRSYSIPEKSEYFQPAVTDHIIVNVLEEGSSVNCPIASDTVRVHYEGRLIASASYSDGMVFDRSFYNNYDYETALPTKFGVSSVVDGFQTALTNMHPGDRWKVYIPYQLGYNNKKSGSVPAYSTLVFDIKMVDFWHPGAVVPGIK